jgi:hypothetical protein
VFFCVLLEYHPMIGADPHNELAPSVPPAVPVEPHAVAAILNFILPASMADDTRTKVLGPLHARVMLRGTDIQSFIPHIPLGPGILLAGLLTLFSGSKSHFGPSSVLACKKPIAAALLVLINPNVNCGTIAGVGTVFAPNTVVAGMTVGDVIGGLFAACVQIVIQGVTNAVFGKLPGGDKVQAIAGGLFGIFAGSPTGFSVNTTGAGPLGIIGRLADDLSRYVRGCGEQVGSALEWAVGDEADARADWKQADADTDGALGDLKKQLAGAYDPFAWTLNRTDPDASGNSSPFQQSLSNSFGPVQPTSNAIDNPHAESF